MITTVGLSLGSIPEPNARWRIVVKAPWTTDGAKLGARWYDGTGSGGFLNVGADNGLSSMALGAPASRPVSSGRYFCMDVRFFADPPALSVSELARQWTERLGGEVLRVKRVNDGESSSAGAIDRGKELETAVNDDGGFLETLGDTVDATRQAGKTAADTLQLLAWAVIIGGIVYMVARVRLRSS